MATKKKKVAKKRSRKVHRLSVNDWLVSTTELAHIWGLSPVRIRQLVRDDRMPQKSHGTFDLIECSQWRQDRALEKSTKTKPLELSRLRETEARTTKHNLEIEQLQGRLIDVDAAVGAILAMAAETAEQFESIPARCIVAPEVKDKIIDECRRARKTLSERVRNLSDSLRTARPSGGDNSPTT